jgi:hypothetical protein
MKLLKRIVIVMVAAVACAGVYGALRNLPVVSGCGFYGDCPESADLEQPATSLAASPAAAPAP